MPNPLIVLAGPTGVGKTALGIELAQALGAEIISADSRQIYRGVDIGTGKPTPGERRRVRHYLISAVSPRQVVTAAGFAGLAGEALEKIKARGKQAMLVGGTGLWIRALVDGLSPTPPSDAEVRAALQERARALGSVGLHEELKRADPVSARKLHPQDALRVIRALEIIQVSGRPASAFSAESPARSLPALWLGLTRPRQELYARAEARIDQWLAQGWLAEVQALLQRGASAAWPAFQALGYAHLARHLAGDLGWDETVSLIKRDTRRYIKRQLTWFTANSRIRWFEAGDPAVPGAMLAYVQEQLLP